MGYFIRLFNENIEKYKKIFRFRQSMVKNLIYYFLPRLIYILFTNNTLLIHYSI